MTAVTRMRDKKVKIHKATSVTAVTNITHKKELKYTRKHRTSFVIAVTKMLHKKAIVDKKK